MRKKKVHKYAKKPIGFLIFVLILLIGVVSVQVSNLYKKNNELEKQKIQIEAEIQNELDKQKELLNYKEFMNSNQYIEQFAREKFGLIKPDEKLFITQYD